MSSPYYLTDVRRRWIRTTSTITNNTPAAIRIIMVLSIVNPLSSLHLFENGLALLGIRVTPAPKRRGYRSWGLCRLAAEFVCDDDSAEWSSCRNYLTRVRRR